MVEGATSREIGAEEDVEAIREIGTGNGVAI